MKKISAICILSVAAVLLIGLGGCKMTGLKVDEIDTKLSGSADKSKWPGPASPLQ